MPISRAEFKRIAVVPLILDDMIQCAQRELEMRRAVHAKRIADGQATTEEEYHEIDTMAAILETLQRLQRDDLKEELGLSES